MGSFAYRIFFISFYIITVVVCLNIMIAFILDVYVTQIATKNKKFMVRDYRRGDTLEDVDDVAGMRSPYRPAGIERGFENFEDENMESPRLRQSMSNRSSESQRKEKET